jgi:hypothetical protein
MSSAQAAVVETLSRRSLRANSDRVGKRAAHASFRYGPERWDLDERAGAALTVHDAIDLALERGRFARVATTTTAAAPR